VDLLGKRKVEGLNGVVQPVVLIFFNARAVVHDESRRNATVLSH
jgi:hypothetical protein